MPAPVFMPEQGAPGDEEAQLTHQGKGQRQKNDNCDKDCVRQHGKLPCRLGSRTWRPILLGKAML
jgi:hypothetical protein